MLLFGLNPFKNASNENNVIDLAFFYFHLFLISRQEMNSALAERAQTVINGRKGNIAFIFVCFCLCLNSGRDSKNAGGSAAEMRALSHCPAAKSSPSPDIPEVSTPCSRER